MQGSIVVAAAFSQSQQELFTSSVSEDGCCAIKSWPVRCTKNAGGKPVYRCPARRSCSDAANALTCVCLDERRERLYAWGGGVIHCYDSSALSLLWACGDDIPDRCQPILRIAIAPRGDMLYGRSAVTPQLHVWAGPALTHPPTEVPADVPMLWRTGIHSQLGQDLALSAPAAALAMLSPEGGLLGFGTSAAYHPDNLADGTLPPTPQHCACCGDEGDAGTSKGTESSAAVAALTSLSQDSGLASRFTSDPSNPACADFVKSMQAVLVTSPLAAAFTEKSGWSAPPDDSTGSAVRGSASPDGDDAGADPVRPAHADMLLGYRNRPESWADVVCTLTSDGVLRVWRPHLPGNHSSFIGRVPEKVGVEASLLNEFRLLDSVDSSLARSVESTDGEAGDVPSARDATLNALFATPAALIVPFTSLSRRYAVVSWRTALYLVELHGAGLVPHSLEGKEPVAVVEDVKAEQVSDVFEVQPRNLRNNVVYSFSEAGAGGRTACVGVVTVFPRPELLVRPALV